MTTEICPILSADLISTHTLTWSVTFPFNANIKIYIHFNSHAHVERDNMVLLNIHSVLHFNSHAHVERDLDFTIF